jgi:hypothetical protein
VIVASRPLVALVFACACGSSASGDPDAAAAAPDASPAPLCDPSHGPVDPAGTDDVTFGEWTTYVCLQDACLCNESAEPFVAGLLACDAVQGGYWWALGSTYARVVGREGSQCIIDVAADVEGGISLWRCTLPLPLAPWPGLMSVDPNDGNGPDFFDGIESSCEMIDSCNIVKDPPGCAGFPGCPPGAEACD